MGFFKQAILPVLVVIAVLVIGFAILDKCGIYGVGHRTLQSEHKYLMKQNGALSLQVSQAAEASHHGFQQMFNDHTAMGTEVERVRRELNEVNRKLDLLLTIATNSVPFADGPRNK